MIGTVDASAHQKGKTMSAPNPSTTTMIQNILRCMPRLYAQRSEFLVSRLPHPTSYFPRRNSYVAFDLAVQWKIDDYKSPITSYLAPGASCVSTLSFPAPY